MTDGGSYESVLVDDLLPHPKNPRRGNVDLIAESIRSNGFYGAVVVQTSTKHIIAGNHRWMAAKQVGLTEVPVMWADVDDETALRILLMDNRSSDLAANDDEALIALLREIEPSPLSLLGTGYDDEAFAQLVASVSGPVEVLNDPDEVPPTPDEPISKLGDIWKLGEHRLVCGDSTDEVVLKTLMDGELADLVFTDPPYGVDYTGGAKRREGLVGDQVGTSIYADSLACLSWAAADHAALYLWYADAHAAAAAAAAAAAGYQITAQIIWVKNHAQFMSSAHYHGKHEACFYAHRKGKVARWSGANNEVTVWEYDRSSRNDFHPTQKPVALATRAAENSSKTGDIILDLFGGSGSTLIAANDLGRRARLVEIDPRYCDVIVQRWKDHTGGEPELIRSES